MKAQKILVPTDFSDNAWRAVEEGVEVARRDGATVHLLFVVDGQKFGPPYIPQGGYVFPTDPEEGFRRLDEIRGKFPDVHMVSAVAIGNPPDEIVRYAAEEEIDLICIATHGRRGFSRFVLGSTTEAVVRRATVPVLTVRGKVEETLHAPTIG